MSVFHPFVAVNLCWPPSFFHIFHIHIISLKMMIWMDDGTMKPRQHGMMDKKAQWFEWILCRLSHVMENHGPRTYKWVQTQGFLSALFVVQVADHHELSEKAVGQQETTNLVMSTVREPLDPKAGKLLVCWKYLKHEVSVFQMNVFASRGAENFVKWSFRWVKFRRTHLMSRTAMPLLPRLLGNSEIPRGRRNPIQERRKGGIQ